MSQVITKGKIASPGIRIGKAFVYHGHEIIIPKYTIQDDKIDVEIARYERALQQTKSEIAGIQEQIAGSLSSDMADIFTSHLMMLDDPQIGDKIKRLIAEKKRNAEWVANETTLELIQSLSNIEDEYLRERIVDISDINKRLISNLQKINHTTLTDIHEEVIVFAVDLTPSETALMNKEHILAFVTDKGGKTSHTAIMARALEIPAIVGTINITSEVKSGDMVIVDAVHGQIIVNPSAREIKEFKRYQADFRDLEQELTKLKELPSETINDESIHIYGNIEIPEEMNIIKNHGAQGIGLFRSEFLFMDKSLPNEEKQFQEYKKVVEYFNPLPVTIRTIDVGGDKVYAYTQVHKERNPFLGCRAIRFSLENEGLFRIQIRAILRASHYGNVKMMFPMISTIEELKKARSITKDVMKGLSKEGTAYNADIPIGIMVEVPSAVINADILSKYCDFFSVGTNDLVQYVLAVDRISAKIAYLYNPLNLSVLRFLQQIVEIAKKTETPISICGEIAGEPQYTMVLLGLGFRHFSMSPTYMYQVKRIIRSVSIKECEDMVQSILQLEDTNDIEQIVRETFKEKFNEIFQ